MLKLMDKVLARIKYLKSLRIENTSEIDFFQKYAEEFLEFRYGSRNIKFLSDVDLFILIYCTYNEVDDFDKFSSKVYYNEIFLEKIIESTICKIPAVGLQQLFFNYKKKTNKIQFDYYMNDKLINDTFFDNEECRNVIKKVCNIKTIESKDPFSLKFYSEEAKKEIDNSLTKIYEKFCNKAICLVIDSLGVGKLSEDMLNKTKKLVSVNNKFYADIEKELLIYDKLIDSLKRIKKEELPFVIDNKMIDDLNDEIAVELYSAIINLNNAQNIELTKEKNNLINSSINKQKYDLKKVGYDIDKIDESKVNFILNYGDISKIGEIINFLNILDYELIDIYSNNGIYVLVNTNLENVYAVNEMVKNKAVTIKFINDNPQIFFNKDIVNDVVGQFDILNKNFKNLSEHYEFSDTKCNEILLLNPNIVYNNIMLLLDYTLNFNKNIIKNNKLIDYVDLFIESGLSEYIKNNIDIIDEDSLNVIKRIYVAKLMNLDVIRDGNLNDILLDSRKFYVENKNLDEYIINDIDDYLDTDIKYLLDKNEKKCKNNDNIYDKYDSYLIDDLTYNFDGVLISRNKFLRNIEFLNNCDLIVSESKLDFNSMIYGSILNEEEILKIKNIINCKKLVK